MKQRQEARTDAIGATLFGIPVVMVDDMPEAGIVIGAPAEREIITLTDMGDGTFEARAKKGETVKR